ncbi:MAG: IMP dehydrogenase, partial [bacterium]
MKLDYSDVLIRPKRSKLTSRAEVDLNRTFTFLHSKRTWTGVPIVAANMDTIGVPLMANSLSPFKAITCMHKFITKGEYDQILNKEYIALT